MRVGQNHHHDEKGCRECDVVRSCPCDRVSHLHTQQGLHRLYEPGCSHKSTTIQNQRKRLVLRAVPRPKYTLDKIHYPGYHQPGSWIIASGTTSWSYTWDTTGVNDGDHTIYARSYDGEDYSDVESLDITVENQDENKIPDRVDGIPGFELIIVIIAIALVLFWKKHRKKQDE